MVVDSFQACSHLPCVATSGASTDAPSPPLASRPPDAPLTDLKAEREDEDRDCWDSKVKLNVQTSKKSISRDLYGPKVKPPVIKVRMGDGGGGEVGRELNV